STSSLRSLARIAGGSTTAVRSNAHRATLGAAARHEYLRRYPIQLVRPDGSTIGVRAPEPLKMFAMPIDLKQLSEDERLQMLAARKPKTKAIVQESIDDNFDAGAYMGGFWSGGAEPAPTSPPKDAAPTKKAAAPAAKKSEKKDAKKK
ncbi:hypothetical protein PFISCL1PPCAC_17381, partial [Pristionchus fissidentatus]